MTCPALPLLAACALALATPVQDLVVVAPDHAKVEFENDRVRVVRLRVPPHGILPQHDRPARVVVSLTPNVARLVRADGTASVTRTEAGTAAWSEPAVRSVENLADVPLENIVIEMKAARGPAKAVASPPAPPPADYLADSRHRWAFENQYVRVYDVRIPPGETSDFHRHAHDAVAVFVSGGLVATQREGEPWGEAQQVAPRTLAFSADASAPVTHRVRNDGPAEYHVILVQLPGTPAAR